MTLPLVFDLPEQADQAGDSALLAFLRENRGQEVEISGLARRRFETPLLQLLLVAAADWRTRGLGFRVTGLAKDHAGLLALIGITPGMLTASPPEEAISGRGAA